MATYRIGNLGVRCDVSEQIHQSWWWLTDPRRTGGQVPQTGGENNQGGPAGKRGRGRQDRVEPGPGGSLSDHLGAAIGVPGQIVGGHVELVTNVWVGEIQHGQVVTGYFADAAANFERVDADIEEVAEQFSPGCLFPVGGIPGTRAAAPVVAAIRYGGVWE